MKNLKALIHEINKGKNLSENFLVYRERLLEVYTGISLLQLSMNAYVLSEKMVEEEGFSDFYRETFETISGALERCVFPEGEAVSMEELDEQIGNLSKAREKLTSRMNIFTSYIDQLENLEYVLNRKELEFEKDAKEEIPDDIFVRKVMEYILSERDAMVINDKIRQVIGQLPVRMTKQRFFDRLRESLTVYKGGDKSALDTFVYMVRTCGMIYHTEGQGEEKNRYEDQMKELRETVFDSLDEENYKKKVAQVEQLAGEFMRESDWHVELAEVINGLMAYLMAQKEKLCYGLDVSRISYEEDAGRLLKSLNEHQKTFYEGNAGAAELQSAMEAFSGMEGIQEELMEQKNLLEAVLPEAVEYDAAFGRCSAMAKLLSTSYFAELEENGKEQADSSCIAQAGSELTKELGEFFKTHEKSLNRAVMANVLTRMPVIFKTPEEIKNYIEYALKQCTNFSEKEISKRLILSLVEEN